MKGSMIMKNILTPKLVEKYEKYLIQEERSPATRKQYRREILRFLEYGAGRTLTKELIIEYKKELIDKYQPVSVNTKLAAINGFLAFAGYGDLKVKQLKIQRRPYCSSDRELTKEEYTRLLYCAKNQGQEKLWLILQTICGMGIRISELPYITAKAVRDGEASVNLKGKNRVILMGKKLRRILKKYMDNQGINSGPLFVTRNGNPMDRSNIWKMMKRLCRNAGVNPHKVFPHNLRHLFARTFYKANKDIVKLADVLGHSNINTTRIYIISTGKEHQRFMDAMGLVI